MAANQAQRTGVRRTVTVLALFVVAVFAWSIIKYLL
jgi:hypothetical protein|tara:strand:+ start:3966 stop:4073 length:108 start_codon:yes stop_codon:yes gene_type:complete